MSKKRTEKGYWTRLQDLQVNPNFWMTKEYIQKAGLVFVQRKNFVGYIEEGIWFLPPLDVETGLFNVGEPVYAGFPNIRSGILDNVLLDFQYIYNSYYFKHMVGKKWSTFRRNVRKYPKRNPGILVYQQLREGDWEGSVEKLLLEWAEGKDLYDSEVLAKYVLQGENRWGLWNKGVLVGINVWDENHYYVNFRYCLDDGTPFLNEYLRLQFYLHINRGKPVNDGGDLGSETLKKFKEKLNPMQKVPVWSYRRK